jgi:hydrogenase expression/formation protein HypE
VVSPLFFPGGDIGELAVNGTVNDLAMSGAMPLFLSAGFILEEGLEMETLGRISASMAQACKKAGVQIAAGDTKVVERGHGDGVYINTTGIGLIPAGVNIAPKMPGPAT